MMMMIVGDLGAGRCACVVRITRMIRGMRSLRGVLRAWQGRAINRCGERA